MGTINVKNLGIGEDFYYTNLTTRKVTVVGPQIVGMDVQAWVRIHIWLCSSKPSGGLGGHE